MMINAEFGLTLLDAYICAKRYSNGKMKIIRYMNTRTNPHQITVMITERGLYTQK